VLYYQYYELQNCTSAATNKTMKITMQQRKA